MTRIHAMSSEADAGDPILSRGFVLGGWRVRPLAGLIEKDGQQRHLEPKVMDVLVCLARHHDEVVTRDQLLAEVWGTVVVSDDAVTRCISELRTVLGDTGRERSYIRTVPRRGYSLVAPIHAVGNGGAHAPAGPAPVPGLVNDAGRARGVIRSAAFLSVTVLVIVMAGFFSGRQPPGGTGSNAAIQDGSFIAPTAPIPSSIPDPADEHIESVAVLPFVNLSGEPEHEYFSDGLSEDIRDALMAHSELRVAARTSSSAFKNMAMDVREIAGQLNVDALLEGTVRIDDGRLRITTALTTAADGFTVWSASFERPVADKLKLQVEVAEEIVRQLTPSLDEAADIVKTSTANVMAHDYYLLGRHHWHERTEEALEQAENYFRMALEQDPDYAPALSGLADTLNFQVPYGSKATADIEDEARAAIERALELEPDLAEAHASLGVLMDHLGRIDDARAAYQRAVELKPQYSMAQMWLGNALLDQRRIDRAHEHYSEALKLDPLHPTVQYNYARSLMGLGRHHEALEVLDRFARTNSTDGLLKARLNAMLALGRYDEVLATATGHTFAGAFKPYTNEMVIETLIQLQRLDEARQMVQDNAEAMDPWWRMWLRASLGVVGRDGAALQQVSDEFLGGDVPHHNDGIKLQCARVMGTYLGGLASYLNGEYAEASRRFDEFDRMGSREICPVMEAEVEIAALLYDGMTKLRLDPYSATGRARLQRARDVLDELRALGWNSLELNTLDAAQHLLAGNEGAARRVVRGMAERGLQPYGLMRSSPLFDDYLDSGEMPAEWEQYARNFEAIRARSEKIELAKLGI